MDAPPPKKQKTIDSFFGFKPPDLEKAVERDHDQKIQQVDRMVLENEAAVPQEPVRRRQSSDNPSDLISVSQRIFAADEDIGVANMNLSTLTDDDMKLVMNPWKPVMDPNFAYPYSEGFGPEMGWGPQPPSLVLTEGVRGSHRLAPMMPKGETFRTHIRGFSY